MAFAPWADSKYSPPVKPREVAEAFLRVGGQTERCQQNSVLLELGADALDRLAAGAALTETVAGSPTSMRRSVADEDREPSAVRPPLQPARRDQSVEHRFGPVAAAAGLEPVNRLLHLAEVGLQRVDPRRTTPPAADGRDTR